MFAEGSKVMDGVFTQQLMLTLTHFMMSLSWKCRLTQQLNSLWHYGRIDKIIHYSFKICIYMFQLIFKSL